jgi:aspartokinase-like uncharacterized kinase
MLDESAISEIAEAVARAQVARLAAAIRMVVARNTALDVAVVTGLGAFLAVAAARDAGLRVVRLSSEFGDEGARCAPAVAVALLFGREHSRDVNRTPPPPARVGEEREASASSDQNPVRGMPGIVVKIGGGSLASLDDFDAVLAVIDDAVECPALIVPGGGLFADAVRDVDQRVGLPDDAAHWMAVLAMDQLAHLIVSRLKRGVLVRESTEVADVLRQGGVPVLAPYRWLSRIDPLPHTWDVTSDSIAAWVAGAIGARRLVLVKPAGARGERLVDARFENALPAEVVATILGADQLNDLRRALGALDARV